MIDLVFWSFVVTVVPIALALGTRLLALVAGPVAAPAAESFFWPAPASPTSYYSAGRVGRREGTGRGR